MFSRKYTNNRSYSNNRPKFNYARPKNLGGSRIKYMRIDPSTLIKKATITESQEFKPTHAFSDFKLDSIILKNLEKLGYKYPTPIQDKAIELILKGDDIIGLASTGTGKTASFLLPIIQKIWLNKSQKAIIITPTRELAQQIFYEALKFSNGLNFLYAILIGGASINKQIYSIRRSPQIVIGTPGRIKDLIERKALNLFTYETIVLDEVDRMLDMGFINDIKEIISRLPEKRQSLFFSATMSDMGKSVANSFLKNPQIVQTSKQRASDNVNQDILRVNGRNKVDLLHDLLNNKEFEKVLVFGRTKHGTEKLNFALRERGFKTASLHGDKSQFQRTKALQAFKENRVNILLATDVASRGIDITDITHVINYELPETYEDYIHRIGRTGRANKTGFAITFID